MSEKTLWPERGRIEVREVDLGGKFTIGASGAVSTQDGDDISGATVTKVAATSGRYLVTPFKSTFSSIKKVLASYEGVTTAAFPTTTGAMVGLRNVTAAGFHIQAIRSDTQADADPASGAIYHWSATFVE